LPRHNKEITVKQDARRNVHKRERQKKRRAMKKYLAEKKSKAAAG
jgi:hypothetical protein